MLAALGTGAATLGPGIGNASSHREAPLTASDPQIDNTDVYAFVSPDRTNTVTLVANWIPFEEPNGGPNFYPFATDAAYDINIDNQGTGRPAITYRWVFTNHYRDTATFLYNTGVVNNLTDPTLNFYQTYDLTEIWWRADGSEANASELVDSGMVAPSDVGVASMPNYAHLRAQAVTPIEHGAGQTLAGQADDPFFLDLRIFDLLYGGKLVHGHFAESGQDTLAGYNVNTIVLQVPKSDLALDGNPAHDPVIGIWSTTERHAVTVFSQTNGNGARNANGSLVQVSRLGNPLVNEVVIGVKDKDRFNASTPNQDAQFLHYVTTPIVPQLIQAIFGLPAPATPRADLVEVFLTGICKACGPIKADLNSQLLNADVNPKAFTPAEELRLNMSVPPAAAPNRLGVIAGDLAGYPNGRRLTDDVVDIELNALEGMYHVTAATALGDGVNANDVPFGSPFPYVALPHHKAVNGGLP